ncbi:hypothetical protein H0H93_014889 [Arthromyces matolae]|nr:hypothetical protein H0H93_014889 [Arthromyces matolae]
MASRRPSPSPQKRTTALKRGDGEPLTRFDLQYDVLYHVFRDSKAVFTDPYSDSSLAKITFHDLYIKTILHSPKATKALKDKMTESEIFADDFAMLALLVNVGRINTTMSFFPEMKTTIRTYHPIPALQRTTGNLQDAPRIKHILKSASLKEDNGPPPSTPSDILSRLPIGRAHLDGKADFVDLFINENLSSSSRALAFLWLCYHYLESAVENADDDYDQDGQTNPFANNRRGNIPALMDLSKDEITQENVDTAEEKALAEKLVAQRLQILKTKDAKETAKQAKVQDGGDEVGQDDAGEGPSKRETIKIKVPRAQGKQSASDKQKESSTSNRPKKTNIPPAPTSDDEFDLDSTHTSQGRPLKNKHHLQTQPDSQPSPRFIAKVSLGSTRDSQRRRISRFSPYPPSPNSVSEDLNVHRQRLSGPPRTMLEQAWHTVTTTDPLLDSDEECADEHLRYDYGKISGKLFDSSLYSQLSILEMRNSSQSADEGETFHVEVILKARVAPPSSDDEEDDEGTKASTSKKKRKRKSKDTAAKPKWVPSISYTFLTRPHPNECQEYLVKWAGYDSKHNSWEPEENVAGCQRLLASFWNHVGTDDGDYLVGYEVAADEKWIKKEKRFFQKEYNEAEEKLRRQRKKDDQQHKKKTKKKKVSKEEALGRSASTKSRTTSLAVSDQDLDSDDKPLFEVSSKRKRKVSETSDDDVPLSGLSSHKVKAAGATNLASKKHNLTPATEGQASRSLPLPTSGTQGPNVSTPLPPIPAPLPPPPSSATMKTTPAAPRNPKLTVVTSENSMPGSVLSTKARLAAGALDAVSPRTVVSPTIKPKVPAPPTRTSSTNMLPTGFKKSTVPTSAMVIDGATNQPPLSPFVQYQSPSTPATPFPPQRPSAGPSSSQAVTSSEEEAAAFLCSINNFMPSEFWGPLRPAEEPPFEPSLSKSFTSKLPPSSVMIKQPWTWTGDVFTLNDLFKPIFSAGFYDVTASKPDCLGFKVALATLDHLNFDSFHNAVDLNSILAACQGVHQFARLGPKGTTDVRPLEIFGAYMSKMQKVVLLPISLDNITIGHIIFFHHDTTIVASQLRPPSDIQQPGSLIAALVPWTLSSGQLALHHRHPPNKYIAVEADMPSLVQDAPQWARTLRKKKNYHHGLRMLKFPRSLHTYLSAAEHERTFSVWFEGGDGTKKKPGIETFALYKILEKCNTKPSRSFSDARIIFVHVGAIRCLEKLPGLLEICSNSFPVQFYSYGTHQAFTPDFWGIREIFPCGGIVTFTFQALLEDPTGFYHKLHQIHSHPMWECYILPSTIGMVAKLYGQKEERDPLVMLDRGDLPYLKLLTAIDDGEISLISSPSNQYDESSTQGHVPRQEWIRRHWSHRPHGARAILQSCIQAFDQKYGKLAPADWHRAILKEVQKDIQNMRKQPVFMLKYRRYVVLHGASAPQVVTTGDGLEWTAVSGFDFKDDFFPSQE